MALLARGWFFVFTAGALVWGVACSPGESGGGGGSPAGRGGSGGSAGQDGTGGDGGSGGIGGTGGNSGRGGIGGSGGGVGGDLGGAGVDGAAGDAGMDCGEVSERAEPELSPVDIIWVVDASGSMSDEQQAITMNINSFATQISNAGIDHHVVIITANDLAAGTALGGDAEHYRFVQHDVGSHDSLTVLLDTYPQYSDFLRDDAPKHFVVVTDDESDVPAQDFATQMQNTLSGEFILHAIASEDAGDGLPCTPMCAQDLISLLLCGGAAAPGLQYYDLADMTGGEKISVCETDWSQVFGPLQDAVIKSVPLPCSYPIPEPPEDETRDPEKVNVEFAPPMGDMKQVFPRAVGGEAECMDGTAWYYDDADDPQTVELCPAACDVVGQGGTISMTFGCKQVIVDVE